MWSGKTRTNIFQSDNLVRVAFQLPGSLGFSIYNATSISNQVLIAIWKIEKQFINKKASMHPKSFKIHFYGAINKKICLLILFDDVMMIDIHAVRNLKLFFQTVSKLFAINGFGWVLCDFWSQKNLSSKSFFTAFWYE